MQAAAQGSCSTARTAALAVVHHDAFAGRQIVRCRCRSPRRPTAGSGRCVQSTTGVLRSSIASTERWTWLARGVLGEPVVDLEERADRVRVGLDGLRAAQGRAADDAADAIGRRARARGALACSAPTDGQRAVEVVEVARCAAPPCRAAARPGCGCGGPCARAARRTCRAGRGRARTSAASRASRTPTQRISSTSLLGTNGSARRPTSRAHQ